MLTKQDIIIAIQKTAKENGGTPLGMARFEQETGIKVYNWKKYWALKPTKRYQNTCKP